MEQSTQNALLDEAIGAARGGDRTKAKDKLTRYLRYDQKNEHAWLWMSAVVESDRERIFCLNNVLKLNPNNKMAKRGLALLGALPADMRADLDIEIIGVDLKADVTTAGAAGKRQKRGGFTFRRNRRLLYYHAARFERKPGRRDLDPQPCLCDGVGFPALR